MVAIKMLTAIALWVIALFCAGFTGAYFEASKQVRDEGDYKTAVQCTAKSIGSALVALLMVYIGLGLVGR